MCPSAVRRGLKATPPQLGGLTPAAMCSAQRGPFRLAGGGRFAHPFPARLIGQLCWPLVAESKEMFFWRQQKLAD